MTKREAVAAFAELVPGIVRQYGRADITAVRTAWNEYTDALQESGQITARQSETWTQPNIARLINEAFTIREFVELHGGAR